MIYFDSSALVKLVRNEGETEALHSWLGGYPGSRRITSTLARVEVIRAVRSDGDEAIRQANRVLIVCNQLPMTIDLLDAAAALAQPLRSLDAIHLATALRIRGDLDAFVAYDKRLLAIADEVGLPIASPGAS